MKKIVISKKKLTPALLAGVVGTITILAIATTFPLNDGDYGSINSWRSWDEKEYGPQNPGWPEAPKFTATGLGVNETYIWPTMGKGDDYPLGALRYLEKRTGYNIPEDYEKFDNQYVYCVANHVENYTLTRGMQAFEMERFQADKPFKACVGEGDVKKFNFIMLAIACNYGTENKDYRPNEPDNAYYGIASQAIAWVNTASPAEQAFGIIKGENFAEDLAAFRNQPIYRAVMNNSFPESTHPSIYRQLHAPSTGWHATAGCKNWFESVFADIWNSAKLTAPMNINWEAEKSTLTGQVEEGDDGYYHMYLNVFQSEQMKSYLNGISFKAIDGSDWVLVEQTAEGIMHFKSPTGEMPEGGSIGVLTWPNGVLGGLMPKDLSSAKLYTFTFYSPDTKTGEYGFGKTQTHFGSVIDKDLEVYITTGDDQPVEGDVKVERFKHTEEFTATYNVNLRKFDSETGKPLEGSHFDILELFDDSQLDDTVLEDDNWANDGGSQFETWDDPDNDPCDRDDNVTDKNGQLYEINSNGAISNTKAHTDEKNYIYEKGYCGGHPVPTFVEIPEPEEDEETGEITNEDSIEEAKEENDRLLKLYMEEVQKCLDLQDEGGYFCKADESSVSVNIQDSYGYDSKEEYVSECNGGIAIPDAKKELEDDRDEHYKDFISLKYEYGAKEIGAPKGYIIHGTHTDDIPIEVRVVTSSEYKDTDMASSIDHSGGGGSGSEEPEEESVSYSANGQNSFIFDGKNGEGIDDSYAEEELIHVASSSNAEKIKQEEKTDATTQKTEVSSDLFVFEDLDSEEEDRDKTDLDDLAEELDLATPSEAEEITQKAEIVPTGYQWSERKSVNPFGISTYGEIRNSTTFKDSKANRVTPPDESIIDWTFIVYNHRTEGEVHINKQDFNLNDKSNPYNPYGVANGDGTLEGALYGLFAATDIVHPDGHTGIVYKKDNLVSIAATDRNGDASFMSITEAPGMTYDYERGNVKKTQDGWADNAPKNLHMNENSSTNKESDIESFIGHNPDNSEITAGNGSDLTDTRDGSGTFNQDYFEKHSSNQGYDDTSSTSSTGSYPISNNEDNNGNCWIGRPIIVSKDGSQYYVKELSRSEGYELSVYGKDNTLNTNKEAFDAGGDDFNSGNVSASKIELDRAGGGNTFTIVSSETTGGYDVILNNIPEKAKIYMTTTEKVWDDSVSHKEQQIVQEPVYAEEGSIVMADGHMWEAKIGDTVTLANGNKHRVNNLYTVENSRLYVKPSNTKKIENPKLLPKIGTSNYIDEINDAFIKNKFRVPSNNAPWTFVPFEELNSQSIADAINDTIFGDDYYSVFNAMSLVGTTAINNQKYAIIAYDYESISKTAAIYNDANDSIYVKKNTVFKSNTTSYSGYIWKEYKNYEEEIRNDTGFIISAYVENEEIVNDSFEWHKENLADTVRYKTVEDTLFWAYASGEQQIGADGELVTKQVITEIDVTPTLVTKITDVPVENVIYIDGVYKFHISQEMAEQNKSDFRIKCENKSVSVDGVEYPADLYVYSNGIVSTSLPITNSDSYIVSVFLTYPGETTVVSDGGTSQTPLDVLERPIRQRIKVMKDILTNPDGTYEHDTYGNVMDTETVDKMDNFRFKVYLKSNLERLYRDEAGEISWVDRNGNILEPEYRDTNGDGNYDTFIWKTEERDEIDYPEYDKDMDEKKAFTGKLSSTNVQKLYTKAIHLKNSTATGDIKNNVDAKSVTVNDELYSYDGINANVGMTDRINENQNSGYTRLLESVDKTIEDGAGKTRKIRSYNYEKFFAAIDVANRDKWDDDMYTTFTGTAMNNYPGQHWEETFHEMYQKDDADKAHTIENTDGADKDNTAGGDRDKSFKPFAWIREHIFKQNGEEKDYYNGTANNGYIENIINTSDYAHANAEASDAVRQFAIDWYLKDEVAKLVSDNGTGEDQGVDGRLAYSDAAYDEALFNAIMKSYNYLKPFYRYDLDTIYSVPWDTSENGGSDSDYTTLSADSLYENGDDGYYYGVSSYLPYGTYVVREIQPGDDQLADFANKHYRIDSPKEVELPSIYGEDRQVEKIYNYDSNDTPEMLASKHYIRFNEEWANNHTDDLRNYVIRAHNHDGDYEIFKYGLNMDRIFQTRIDYDGGTYTSDGYNISQDEFDPLKDYYNSPLVDMEKDGGNVSSHYFADDKNVDKATANGLTYAENAIERRYHYGSISEDQGTANNVLYPNGSDRDDNNPTGFYFKDNVVTMAGNQTAYQDKYAPMLVPWSVTEPVSVDGYDAVDFSGYADVRFRNTFYVTKLRIEKLDSETGENILHDDAIFAIYAAERYLSDKEIKDAINSGIYGTDENDYPQIGDVKIYTKDTTIFGSLEFLEGMNASNIQAARRKGAGELYSGVVPAGTPICKEEDQILLTDFGTIKDGLIYKQGVGDRTGTFKALSTLAEVLMEDEEDKGTKTYGNQDTGYVITPAPLGSGTYVLAEIKAPSGYVKSNPIAVEVYSDSVEYYKDGDRFSKVPATIYTENIIK